MKWVRLVASYLDCDHAIGHSTHDTQPDTPTWNVCSRLKSKKGVEMASEKSQMAAMTASVRCLVTRDRSGNMIAM